MGGELWYMGSFLIRKDTQCNCTSNSLSNTGLGANLTFSNKFQELNVGSYGCWRNFGGIFDVCNFEVVAVGKLWTQ